MGLGLPIFACAVLVIQQTLSKRSAEKELDPAAAQGLDEIALEDNSVGNTLTSDTSGPDPECVSVSPVIQTLPNRSTDKTLDPASAQGLDENALEDNAPLATI